MQQHSEAYLRVMKNQRQRKTRKKVLLAALALGIGAGVLGMLTLRGHQEVKTAVQQPIVTAGVATHFVHITDLPEWYTETEDKGIDLDDSDAYLLAKIAMAEAEGEDIIGKALVIRTILNRVESDNAYFPDTVSEVIFQKDAFQKDAFTPTRNGRFEKVEPNEDCYAALELIKEGWDDSHGALYFERNTIKETWHSRNLEKLFVHGNHTFYTEE